MQALIIMTRIPIAGKTKTRLMEILSGEACAQLHICFLKDYFQYCQAIKEQADIYLTYTPEDSFHIIEKMVPSYISSFPQEGKDLGERMANAMKVLFNKGYKKVVLIGSDIPELHPREILDAFNHLNSSDICIGPTADGGYYLIGAHKLHEELFDQSIKWGNKTVLEGTIDIANRLELNITLINKHRDIDTKWDLLSFIEKIKQNQFPKDFYPENTIHFIKNYWSEEQNAEQHIEGKNH
jgi:uncharacterized protein